MAADLHTDWRPVTLRCRSRATVTAGVRHLKDHLPEALRSVAAGDSRIVVRRHRQLVAALVPMPDYWFLIELEEELKKCGWRPRCPRLQAADVATAIVWLSANPKAAERLRRRRAAARGPACTAQARSASGERPAGAVATLGGLCQPSRSSATSSISQASR